MITRILIPVFEDEVAPRFDLATEVVIAIISDDKVIEELRNVMLQRSSPEDLCHSILAENINVLICGAIEDEFYQFLKWKKLFIYENVSGKYEIVFDKYLDGTLRSGDLLFERMVEGEIVR